MRTQLKLERLLLKSDLANWLGWQAGYGSYLELTSLISGHQFQLIDPEIFSDIRRVRYRMPPGSGDGAMITHQTASADSTECLRPLLAAGARFDLVFVDSYHDYESSRRDLELARELLRPDGTLLVHDCLPTTPEVASPDYHTGEWSGLTYLAFLDFMRDHPELEHCVIDTDYGCGAVRRRATSAPPRGTPPAHDYRDWATYLAHRHELLNVVTVAEFVRRFRRRPRRFDSHLYHAFAPVIDATGIFNPDSCLRRGLAKLRG